MSRLDIEYRAVLWSGLTVAAVVSGAIGVALVLLHAWHEPPGGAPSGAASLVPALRALGPTLQSAPQLDAAVQRAADGASPAAR
jgi:hypothetical protein